MRNSSTTIALGVVALRFAIKKLFSDAKSASGVPTTRSSATTIGVGAVAAPNVAGSGLTQRRATSFAEPGTISYSTTTNTISAVVWKFVPGLLGSDSQ